MKTGAVRTDVAYAWPRLTRPDREAWIVYLDLNHWIELAKASVGHPEGEPALGALRTIRDLRARGRIILPLSATHYMEVCEIGSRRRRADLAQTMEELSDFDCLMDRMVVIRMELEEALSRLVGDGGRVYGSFPLIGNGVLQAFGRRGGLQIRDRAGRDVTDQTRRTWAGGAAAFDAWRADGERLLNRSVLAGPKDDAESVELRQQGWAPERSAEVTERRAEQEREQAARLADDPRWRRGRLRDIVAARYLALEIHSALEEECGRRGIDFEAQFAGPEAARRFTDSMPSADTWITLLTAAHRNPSTRWTANDIYDADALSVAVPYCDYVATERHATHVLHAAGLPERTETTVVATLDELVEGLRAVS